MDTKEKMLISSAVFKARMGKLWVYCEIKLKKKKKGKSQSVCTAEGQWHSMVQ